MSFFVVDGFQNSVSDIRQTEIQEEKEEKAGYWCDFVWCK